MFISMELQTNSVQGCTATLITSFEFIDHRNFSNDLIEEDVKFLILLEEENPIKRIPCSMLE